MLENLLQYDTSILIWIHKHLHNVVFDWLMPLLRNKVTWIPLYVFLVAFALFNFGKRGGLWILFAIFTVALSDTVSSQLIKYNVQRLRPCHTELADTHLKLLVPCGGRYSFTSSHATNHFAIAVFLLMTLGRIFRKIRWPLLIWASVVSIAQVYVGVHYPLDILAGAIVGSIIGAGIAWYYIYRMRPWSILKPSSERKTQDLSQVTMEQQN